MCARGDSGTPQSTLASTLLCAVACTSCCAGHGVRVSGTVAGVHHQRLAVLTATILTVRPKVAERLYSRWGGCTHSHATQPWTRGSVPAYAYCTRTMEARVTLPNTGLVDELGTCRLVVELPDSQRVPPGGIAKFCRRNARTLYARVHACVRPTLNTPFADHAFRSAASEFVLQSDLGVDGQVALSELLDCVRLHTFDTLRHAIVPPTGARSSSPPHTSLWHALMCWCAWPWWAWCACCFTPAGSNECPHVFVRVGAGDSPVGAKVEPVNRELAMAVAAAKEEAAALALQVAKCRTTVCGAIGGSASVQSARGCSQLRYDLATLHQPCCTLQLFRCAAHARAASQHQEYLRTQDCRHGGGGCRVQFTGGCGTCCESLRAERCAATPGCGASLRHAGGVTATRRHGPRGAPHWTWYVLGCVCVGGVVGGGW